MADPADLKARAQAGDPEAMTVIAKALLRGPSAARLHGLAMLDSAAHKGGGEAAAMVAVCAGEGFLTGRDWAAALRYADMAAKAGWAPARTQLERLSDLSLADAASIDRWLAEAPSFEELSPAPAVAVAENFLPAPACGWLIDRARDRLRPAEVYHPETHTAAHAKARSNSAAAFQFEDLDLILVLVRARIARMLDVTPRAFEPTSVLHYAVGQRFAPHVDWLDPAAPASAADIAAGGQRAVTLLIYLNEDFDGGETAFPRIGAKFKPRTGGALMFRNLLVDGAPDPAALHAGLAPTRGEKWLLSQFVRQPAQAPVRSASA